MKVMTMQQFLKNPSGPYSAYFSRRDLIINNMEERYYDILKKAGSSLKVEMFNDKGDYYFYFKFPSEKFYDKLLYDVVIQLIPIGGSNTDLTLNNYAVKVFSNSPNFLFTYAYIYNQDGILIDFLKDKVSELALTKAPVIKNSNESYGFEKSVYFALIYIREHRLFNKSTINNMNSNKLDKKKLLNEISNCDDKLKEYNIEKKKISEDKKKEKAKNKTKGKPKKTSKKVAKRYNI